jgi:hypothetical protein
MAKILSFVLLSSFVGIASLNGQDLENLLESAKDIKLPPISSLKEGKFPSITSKTREEIIKEAKAEIQKKIKAHLQSEQVKAASPEEKTNISEELKTWNSEYAPMFYALRNESDNIQKIFQQGIVETTGSIENFYKKISGFISVINAFKDGVELENTLKTFSEFPMGTVREYVGLLDLLKRTMQKQGLDKSQLYKFAMQQILKALENKSFSALIGKIKNPLELKNVAHEYLVILNTFSVKPIASLDPHVIALKNIVQETAGELQKIISDRQKEISSAKSPKEKTSLIESLKPFHSKFAPMMIALNDVFEKIGKYFEVSEVSDATGKVGTLALEKLTVDGFKEKMHKVIQILNAFKNKDEFSAAFGIFSLFPIGTPFLYSSKLISIKYELEQQGPLKEAYLEPLRNVLRELEAKGFSEILKKTPGAEKITLTDNPIKGYMKLLQDLSVKIKK